MSLTRKLFWEDMYIREFDAIVIGIKENGLILDQTAFNPRGGGLVSDIGYIGKGRVLEVVKEGDTILHMIENLSNFSIGRPVHCILDWERRYRIMKMHTTAHILSAIIHNETGALITGNQIRPDESRIDFSLEQFDKDKLIYYVNKVNVIAKIGIEVETYFMKREEALKVPGFVKLANATPPEIDVLRIVKIGDIDSQADGGVHVKNTAEIGNVIPLRAENKGKANKRIYYTIA